MNRRHNYGLTIKWTGNKGKGTTNYRSYDRSHSIQVENKVEILASSDPAFSGDETKYNPEELLLASLSSCHMLWYLHLCSEAGVVVVDYSDTAFGTMIESDAGGCFIEAILNPHVTVTKSKMVATANEMHKKANELCFIANSVSFPVHHNPVCFVSDK